MELLSPAGHWEAMVAAVQNGADAVYLGMGDFNARRGAKNFSREDFPAAVAYCHLRGVKVYLTLNTLLTDRELPRAKEDLLLASRTGADAAIVQDWGLAALAREICPDLPLHGSTQMTIHSLRGARAAAALGMRCVVLGRELSKDDIAHICRHSPIPVESFAHGALCMCWSGQCTMSALIGGRSGNRGACAQPCRLPYRLDGGEMGRPLSLKDACLARHLGELRDMGVSILKLEGRMKRPEYVAVVTRIYADLLRENRAPTGEELRTLELAFSRQGFTDGYWQGRPGPHMLGSRPENAPEPTELFAQAKAAYEREDLRTVPVALSVRIRAREPARLTTTNGGHAVTVTGPVPEAARTRPLTAGDLRSRLGKTGGTVFRAQEIFLDLEEGLSLPASAVNGLRREALEALAVKRAAPPERREAEEGALPVVLNPTEPPTFTVSLAHGAQLTAALLDLSPAVVYLPAERIEEFDLSPYRDRRVEFSVTLPRICKDGEEEALVRLLTRAKELGCVSAAVQNLGQVSLAGELGFTLRGDYGLNVFNSRSLAALERWGLRSATLSFELRHEQIRDIHKFLPCEAIIYGRLPLMVTENCLMRNVLGCQGKGLSGLCGQGHILTDRRGEGFPVFSVFGCRNEIENGKILFLADKPEYRRAGLTYGRLRFTTETPAECVAVMERYCGAGDFTPEGYTRGLFYRGVE